MGCVNSKTKVNAEDYHDDEDGYPLHGQTSQPPQPTNTPPSLKLIQQQISEDSPITQKPQSLRKHTESKSSAANNDQADAFVINAEPNPENSQRRVSAANDYNSCNEEEDEPPLLTLRPLESDDPFFLSNNVESLELSGTDSSYDSSESSTMIGYDFLDYHAIRVIGSGASSTVVQMVRAGMMYAVKICDLKKFKPNFLKAESADPKTEAVILKRFDFPFVVKMYDFCEEFDTNRFFIVMELLSGGDISKCETNAEKKVAFVQSVLALRYIHLQRIAHRDIKAENVLRHKDGSIRIADFGVSEFIPEGVEKISLPIKGTLAYSAPEVLGDQPYNPFLSDIWALGILLYFIMFSELPFYALKIIELKKKIERDEIIFPKNTNPKLIDLIKMMLKKVPEDRISLEKILEHPWVQKAKGKIDMNKYLKKQKTLYNNISEKERKSSIQRIRSVKSVLAM